MSEFAMTRGLPYARRIRLVNGRATWPTLDAFEVRSQIRAGRQDTSGLVFDLTPFLTPSFDGNDIVVDLSLTGTDTRSIERDGHYDVVISDPGIVDARAVSLLSGAVRMSSLVTAAADA